MKEVSIKTIHVMLYYSNLCYTFHRMKIADTSFYVFQALNSLSFFRINRFINNKRVQEAQLKLADNRKQLQ